MATKTPHTCHRCGGTGQYKKFGECFTCKGSGKTTVRARTDKSQAAWANAARRCHEGPSGNPCLKQAGHVGACGARDRESAGPAQCNGGEPHARCTRNRGHRGACAPSWAKAHSEKPSTARAAEAAQTEARNARAKWRWGTLRAAEAAKASGPSWSDEQRRELDALVGLFED